MDGPSLNRVPPARVVVGGSYWTLNGVNVFSANLVRGLRARGVEAEILLTEEDTDLIAINDAAMPEPAGVPMARLPVARWGSWGAHWGAMIRYLEDRAPCIYIPNSDWRHSCVSPLLSEGVRIVGVVHSDDPLHYDHVRRLGRYWDAIVTTSPVIARKTLAIDDRLGPRLSVIPIGVEIPHDAPSRLTVPGQPLRVIYPGTLKQHQKRVLDLPQIVEAAERRNIPMRMTIAGGGPDEAALRAACAPFVDRGLINFTGVVEHGALLSMLEEHDVFVMTSEFEGLPNALLEAMGRGCVPLATNIESGIPDLITDDVNGYLVEVGDIDAFAERLSRLAGDAAERQRMSLRAHEAVSSGKFRVDDMVESYAALCSNLMDAPQTAFTRPHGPLNHPPADIGGVGIFPVELLHEEPGVGLFPSWLPDLREFGEHILALERPEASPLVDVMKSRIAQSHSRLQEVEVIAATPDWLPGALNDFTANLVRGLIAAGIKARVLVTESDTRLVDAQGTWAPVPDDIPFDRLPVTHAESWGGHWGAMIRYLEDHAPCIYIPNHDWRHSCISPVLSKSIVTVGIVYGDDPLHRDHVRRLGRYWDGIVTHDPSVAAALAADSDVAPRTYVVNPIPQSVALDYREVFAKILDDHAAGRFQRPDGPFLPPPRAIDGTDIFPAAIAFDIDGTETANGISGPVPLVDRREFRNQLQRASNPLHPRLRRFMDASVADFSRLRGVKVIAGSPAWHRNGVNEFAETLVRELSAGGVDAHVLLTEEDTDLVNDPQPPKSRAGDVRFARLPVDRQDNWGAHWGATLRYLEERAPCIYIPNHDWRHACVCPLLSDRVAVIGILHQDNPLYRDQAARLGPYLNAVVTYDGSLTTALPARSRSYALEYKQHGVVQDYLEIFGDVLDDIQTARFRRPAGQLRPPPREIGGVGVFQVDLGYEKEGVGWFSTQADYDGFEQYVTGARPRR